MKSGLGVMGSAAPQPWSARWVAALQWLGVGQALVDSEGCQAR